MKKLYVVTALFLTSLGASAQNDTLLWQDFQDNNIQSFATFGDYPPGLTSDTAWYTFDLDLGADLSGANPPRPDWPYWVQGAFAEDDRILLSGDTNLTFWSNSWLVGGIQADNWIVSPAVQIVDNQAVLRFKSASLQTPYYLDGYEILISTMSNAEGDFSTVLYTAAEYTGGASSLGPDYASYTFAPVGQWIQGWDGANIVWTEIDTSISTFSAPDPDSARFEGRLTERVVNLGAYAGQTVFIAIHHNTVDDNLISFDDILITGTAVGVKEHMFNIGIKAFPNPATDHVQLTFNMENAADVTIQMYDALGRDISTQQMGTLSGEQSFRLNVASLAPGTYNVSVKTNQGNGNISFIKQ